MLKLTQPRNFEESGVEGACGAGETRSCATSSIAGDEEEARGRGGGVIT